MCVHAFVPVRGWASQDVSVIIKTLFMKEQSRGLFCGYAGLFGDMSGSFVEIYCTGRFCGYTGHFYGWYS